MKRTIKNYTTDVPVQKTILEIQNLLVQNGARGIATEYDSNGMLKDIFFKIMVKERELPFRLPANPDAVYAALHADALPHYHEWYGEQWKIEAQRIAWRICKTWLEAQLTLINLEQARIEEVFLPYLVMPGKKTLYEVMKGNQFLLPSGSS
jgi:hypothetical protein